MKALRPRPSNLPACPGDVDGAREAHARPLIADDWDWLAAWAADEVVDRELGPIDRAWLDQVLVDETGIELVVTDGRRPFALVGCVWDPSERSHVISDIAVDPQRRGEGLGRCAIDAALAWGGHPYAAEWTAYVSPRNTTALRFFRAMGWRDLGLQDSMQRFSTRARRSAARRTSVDR